MRSRGLVLSGLRARLDKFTKIREFFCPIRQTTSGLQQKVKINGFKLFDQNLALTAGQPFIIQADGSSIKTTEMLALNIYSTFYNSKATSTGVAQAKAVLFFILVAGLGLLQLGYTRKREVQQ